MNQKIAHKSCVLWFMFEAGPVHSNRRSLGGRFRIAMYDLKLSDPPFRTSYISNHFTNMSIK